MKMLSVIALLLLMTPLIGCKETYSTCPHRVYMPSTLKVKLKALRYSPEEEGYWEDLVVQQDQLPK